jgi:hypothetical protein
MSTLFWILGVALLVSLAPLTVLLACRYLGFRQGRRVVCPHTYAEETVHVDAARAAWTSVAGDAELRLVSCSGSSHQPGCNQSCRVQLEVPASEAARPGEPAAEIGRLAG